MKLSTATRTAAASAALAGTLVLAACGAANETSTASSTTGTGSAPPLSGTVNGAGSSAQQAAMAGWTAGFSATQPGVTVNYDPVGSGGGRDQFLAGGTDFAGSDAALSDTEVAKAQSRCGSAGVFELPDYISPIALVYNLPGVQDLNLSPATIAGIFTGALTTWNDPAIARDNPKATLPNTAITAVHRSDKSGTTENFTDYLAAAAPGTWTAGTVQDWPATGGEAGAQTSGLIAAVKAGTGAIGYADASQAGGLSVARVKVGADYVAPSAEAAAAVVANSDPVPGRGTYDFAIKVKRDTTGSGQYPIVLVSYHIGCIQYDNKDTSKLVKAFFGYVISKDGQQAAADAAGNAPISDKLRQQAQTAVDAITAAS